MTLKQIEAAQSVLNTVRELLDSYRPRTTHGDVEGRFLHAVNVIARDRIREIDRELYQAWNRAYKSSEQVTLIDVQAFEAGSTTMDRRGAEDGSGSV